MIRLPAAIFAVMLSSSPLPGHGAAAACEVALALTVDVSGSIDAAEYRLQMDGLAAALADAAVAEALVRAKARLALIQWSGTTRQDVTIPWADMADFAAVTDFARQVAAAQRPWRHFSTAIGDVLHLAGGLFADVACARHVIDVSGDGASNEGTEPRDLRKALAAAGVTVNALAILGATEQDLPGYFRENVITGPHAFVYVAKDYADYPRAIRRKLLDELTEPVS